MRKLLLFLIFFLFYSCSNEKSPVGPTGPIDDKSATLAQNTALTPLKVSSNSRYLTDQSGTPFFLSADAAWSLIVQVSTADADYYLQNRAAYGFNCIIVNLIEHQFSDHPPSNFYNQQPFTGATFTTPNEAYFAHVDDVLNLAASRGIIVMLFPAYTGYDCGGQGWCAEMKSASTAAMNSWGQYVGNRYKNFPNIIWSIGGDANPSPVKTKLQAMIDGIKQTDPNHPMTAHNAPESFGITPWPGQLNINNVYTYSNTLFSNCKTAYNYTPRMPFFLMESSYEGEHNSTPTTLRSQAYWTILSGGCGEVFGNNPIWLFGNGWKNALTSAGSSSMKNLVKLFTSRNWQNLVPDFSPQKVMTSGASSGSVYATTASTTDSSTIIAYVPSTRPFTINLNYVKGTQATCWWYNPSTGAATSIGTFPRGSRSFTPPSNADWVFVADATVLGLPAPGTAPVAPLPTGVFTASPSGFPYGGGSALLSWTSQNATSASLNNGIGSVGINDSAHVTVNATMIYTLTLVGPGGSRQYTDTVTVAPPPLPSGTFTAPPDTLPFGGGQVMLHWTSQNADTVSINQGIGVVAKNDSLAVNPTSTTIYTLKLVGPGGTRQYSDTINVAPPPLPTGTFTASADSLPVGGGPVMLHWTTLNATSATINQGIGPVALNDSFAVNATATTMYTLSIAGPGGNRFYSLTVNVAIPPPPSGSISADPASLPVGGGSVMLHWTSLDAATATIDQGIGTVATNDSISVNLTSTKAYTLTLTGPGGVRTFSVTVNVAIPPPPTGSILAVPASLPVGGGSVMLQWNSLDATSAAIDQGIGSVATNDSIAVNLTSTTTYHLTLAGPGGTVQPSVTINVAIPPPATGLLTATPGSLPVGGGQVTLRWSSQNATSASLNQGIGAVGTNDSLVVNVTATATYTLSLAGPGGGGSSSATVTVAIPPPPTGSLSVTPASLPVGGGQVKLRWTSLNATSISINQGIGAVGANDSLTLNVTASTTYTLSLASPQGNATYNSTVTVTAPPPPGEAIYTETTYSNSWNTIRSWSVTLTPTNASPVENGSTSLKVVHAAWASLQFSKGTWGAFTNLNPADYVSVSFWVNGGPAGVTLNLSAINSSNGNVKTPVTFTVPANAWVQKTIPMSTLSTTTFVAFGLNAGGSSVTFYLDDFILNK